MKNTKKMQGFHGCSVFKHRQCVEKTKEKRTKKGRCPYLIDKKDCKVMLSNSDTELARELYKGFRIETVFAKRAINCKPSGRGEISELVILNY